MRKAELMAKAKELGVKTRKQTTLKDGKVTTTWRSTADVAQDCQEALQLQQPAHDVPGSASTTLCANNMSDTRISAEHRTSEYQHEAFQPQHPECVAPGSASTKSYGNYQ